MNPNQQQKNNTLTVKQVKEKYPVSQKVKDSVKEFKKISKKILESLEKGQKTIPQLVKDTGMETGMVTWYVMSMEKFGFIEANDVDDDDFYFYRIPQKEV